MKEKPLKLRNHLVIAAFGAHFSSHYSVDILAERHKHKIVVFFSCLCFVGSGSTGVVSVQVFPAVCD